MSVRMPLQSQPTAHHNLSTLFAISTVWSLIKTVRTSAHGPHLPCHLAMQGMPASVMVKNKQCCECCLHMLAECSHKFVSNTFKGTDHSGRRIAVRHMHTWPYQLQHVLGRCWRICLAQRQHLLQQLIPFLQLTLLQLDLLHFSCQIRHVLFCLLCFLLPGCMHSMSICAVAFDTRPWPVLPVYMSSHHAKQSSMCEACLAPSERASHSMCKFKAADTT